MPYHQYVGIPLSQPVIDAIAKATPKEKRPSKPIKEGPVEDECILITKVLQEYREEPNIIRLRNNEILQVGLKRDQEDLDEFLEALEKLQRTEKFEEEYAKEHPTEPVRKYHRFLQWRPGQEGAVESYFKAGDILYEFEKNFVRIFPEIKYLLKIRHYDTWSYEPRIKLPKKIIEKRLGQIQKIFPDFELQKFKFPDIDIEEITKTPYTPYKIMHMPKELVFEDDYSEHDFVWYDDDYNTRIVIDSDPHEQFYLQKVPKRNRGSLRAHYFGTAQKEIFLKEEHYDALKERRRKKAMVTRK